MLATAKELSIKLMPLNAVLRVPSLHETPETVFDPLREMREAIVLSMSQ
jgi:hypothetical protein